MFIRQKRLTRKVSRFCAILYQLSIARSIIIAVMTITAAVNAGAVTAMETPRLACAGVVDGILSVLRYIAKKTMPVKKEDISIRLSIPEKMLPSSAYEETVTNVLMNI